jgi:hypothetical protein
MPAESLPRPARGNRAGERNDARSFSGDGKTNGRRESERSPPGLSQITEPTTDVEAARIVEAVNDSNATQRPIPNA